VTRSEATPDRLSGSLIGHQPETWLKRDLAFQDRALGRIYAEIDISNLVQARRDVLVTLVVTNMLLTGLLAGLGWWLVHRMMRPMQSLTVRLQRGTNGNLPLFSKAEIGDPTSEFGRLFGQYNAMALAVSEREALSSRLAEEERLASLGRLSSVIAHEINNPLGGLLNAVDTIKRHGNTASVRNVSVGLLERGLNSIREVVETTLAVYRPDRNPRPLRPSDIEDLRLLIDGVATRQGVTLDWANRLKPSSILPAGPIRQIVLNLVINAVNAVPRGGRVGLSIRTDENDVVIRVFDNGPGMPEGAVQALTSEAPPKTPNAKDGIGLWMVNRLLSELGGQVHVLQPGGTGTDITLRVPTKGEVETSDVA
jgi:signal transduction histidine kinase